MKTDRFLIITSRFNEDVTANLTQGARETLLAEGVKQEHISELSVPGSFELPSVAAKAAASGKWQAILCLGCLIKGETDHYDYICEAVANGLTSVGVQYRMPVLFGVLTAHNKSQALARSSLQTQSREFKADGKIVVTNKGRETALAALLTLKTLGELDGLTVKTV
jgi:6,7-dimethyl-8-ribityllumazine synthase